MEGYDSQPPSGLITGYWSPGWNSIQALNKFQQEVGGPLRGGDPGIHLINPSISDPVLFFDPIPSVIQKDNNERLFIAVYHIFGSEELSMRSPAIKKRAPEPYLALSPDDPLAIVGKVSFTLGHIPFTLPVKQIPGLPLHLAGLPVGLPGLPVVSLPVVAKISKWTGP
jgi:NADH-quinone oxidoreductase subunit G